MRILEIDDPAGDDRLLSSSEAIGHKRVVRWRTLVVTAPFNRGGLFRPHRGAHLPKRRRGRDRSNDGHVDPNEQRPMEAVEACRHLETFTYE